MQAKGVVLINNYVSPLVPEPDVIITTSPDYGYYYYGEDVTLSCIVSYPTNIQNYIDVPTQAKIQWIKDDGNIIDDDNVEPINNMYISNMTLSNINASNGGIYNCTAVVDSNDKDIIMSSIAHASIGLSVKGKQCFLFQAIITIVYSP